MGNNLYIQSSSPGDVEFKTTVWKLQCKYAKLCNNYALAINYGTICDGQKEKLKSFRRFLVVLNRYDIRDINSNTMDYNKISYDTIKNIVIHLQNKY